MLGLVLAAGVGYALWVAWSDPRLAGFHWQFHPLPVALAFLLMIGSSATTVPLWMAIYRGLGGRVRVRDGFRIYLVSNVGKYLPGKVGHAAGRVVMLKAKGQPASIGVTSILVELALSLLGAILLSLLSIPILLHLQGLGDQLGFVTPLALLALPAGLIGLHPLVMSRILRLGSRVLPGGAELCTDLPPYRLILVLLVCYVALWFTMSVGLFATAQTVYPLGWEWLPAMGGVSALSYLFGLVVPFAPAGLGAREGLMTVMLSTMMPPPAAIVTSILYRAVSISAETIAAGLAAVLIRER
ncbi:MAG: flippase-like domain-containing protein [Chloroflexi bacterium]|nr:flippase-like domain-containing protein [Chloroflexota bacterium]